MRNISYGKAGVAAFCEPIALLLGIYFRPLRLLLIRAIHHDPSLSHLDNYTGIGKQTNMTSISQSTPYVGWVSDAGTRGTLDIIQTCVSTLFLCAYTTLHLDVPSSSLSFWQQTLRTAKWVVVGMLAPEVVLACAAKDLALALQVQKYANRQHGPSCPIHGRSNNSLQGEAATNEKINGSAIVPVDAICKCQQRKNSWTLKHSFFAVMGGYHLLVPDGSSRLVSDEEQQAPNHRSMRLTARNALNLHFLRDDFEVPTVKQLADRSKMTSVVKVLSYFQAAALCVQVIGRLISGISVTELEGNTIAHAVCAFTSALLWLKKPYNVMEPDTIHAESRLGWFIVQRYVVRISPGIFGENSSVRCEAEGDLLSICERAEVAVPNTEPVEISNQQLKQPRFRVVLLDDFRIAQSWFEPANPAQKLPSNVFLYVKQEYLDISENFGLGWKSSCTTPESQIIPVSEEGLILLRRFWSSLGDNELKAVLSAVALGSDSNDEAPNSFYHEAGSGAFLGFDTTWLQHQSSYLIVLGTLILLSGLYGGLHLAFWNAHFPSTAERWIWRIAATIVACVLLVVSLLSVFFHCILRICDKWTSLGDLTRSNGHASESVSDLPETAWAVLKVLPTTPISIRTFALGLGLCALILFCLIVSICLTVGVLLFCCARVFLVLEAFISLRSQARVTYQQVPWAKYIPHI